MSQSAAIKQVIDDKADTPKAKVKAAVDQAAEKIEDTAERAQETVNDLTNQANDELRKITDTGAQFVRENPGTAIAGALGIGILVGLALRGRD